MRKESRRFGRGVGIGVVLLSVFALSGCLNATGQYEIGADGLVSGSLQLEVSKEAAALAGIFSLDSLEQQVTDQGDGPLCADVDWSESESAYIIACEYDKEDFSNNEPLQVTKADQVITMRYISEESGSGEGEAEGLFDDGEGIGGLSITVDFPGPVDQVTGPNASVVTKVDDDTVKIAATATEAIDVTVTSGITEQAGGISVAGSDSPPWIIAAVVVALLAVVGVGAYLFVRRSKAPAGVEMPAHTLTAATVPIDQPVAPVTYAVPPPPAQQPVAPETYAVPTPPAQQPQQRAPISPPGWYDHPAGIGQRYWDGTRWLDVPPPPR